MERIKYLTKRDLLEASRAAIRERRSRVIPEDVIERFSDDMRVVARFYYHSRHELRLLLDIDGKHYQVDISHTRYHSLPDAIRLPDGTVIYGDVDGNSAKRPYPNPREWKEVVVTSPVRDQDRFRRTVLRAYESQCAVCDVREPGILRAAHIVDVADGGSDETSNGICLCINHEVAFDRGLLLIHDTFEISVVGTDGLQVARASLRLPSEPRDVPSREYLRRKLEATRSKDGPG